VNADQRIAATDGVVQELEWLVLGQRQLGHLDGERVLVHAVQAALGDDAPGVGQPLVQVERHQLLAGKARGS
jgi:hypothetical protein